MFLFLFHQFPGGAIVEIAIGLDRQLEDRFGTAAEVESL